MVPRLDYSIDYSFKDYKLLCAELKAAKNKKNEKIKDY